MVPQAVGVSWKAIWAHGPGVCTATEAGDVSVPGAWLGASCTSRRPDQTSVMI